MSHFLSSIKMQLFFATIYHVFTLPEWAIAVMIPPYSVHKLARLLKAFKPLDQGDCLLKSSSTVLQKWGQVSRLTGHNLFDFIMLPHSLCPDGGCAWFVCTECSGELRSSNWNVSMAVMRSFWLTLSVSIRRYCLCCFWILAGICSSVMFTVRYLLAERKEL